MIEGRTSEVTGAGAETLPLLAQAVPLLLLPFCVPSCVCCALLAVGVVVAAWMSAVAGVGSGLLLSGCMLVAPDSVAF